MPVPAGSTIRLAGPFFQPRLAIVTVPDGAARGHDALLDDEGSFEAAIEQPESRRARQVTAMTARRERCTRLP